MRVSAMQRHHVKVTGRGTQGLVFAHGFGCDQTVWRYVAPAFESTHQVLLFDHAGCGQADPCAYDEQRHASLEGYADDLLDIVDESGLQQVVLVGHSVSSVIGLLAAIRRPERFVRLVLLAPSPRFLNDPPDYVGGFDAADLTGLFDLMESNHFGWAHFLAPIAIGERNPAALTREFEDGLCRLDPVVARRFAQLAFYVDVRHRLAEVQVPSLIVQCSDDSIAPRSVGAYMHRHLAGSRLVEIEASGHCPHLSHPQQTIDVLRAELELHQAAHA